MATKPTYEELEQRIKELETKDREVNRQDITLEILKALPGTLNVIDTDYNIIMVGGEIARTLENIDRVIGEKCYKVFQKRDKPCPWCKTDKVLKTGAIINETTTPDDHREKLVKKPLNVYLRPLKDKGGNIIGVIELGTDITQIRKAEEKQKRAEEALRENKRFLQNVFDGIQDGISVLDRDLTIIDCNFWMEDRYAEHMPLVGKKCYKVYQGLQSPCPWCPSIPALKTGEVHSEVVPYPSTEAPSGWIELSSFPLKDRTGSMVGVIEHVKDITSKKQTENALRESEEKYRNLVEESFDGIFIQRGQSIIFANKRLNEMLGYREGELIGQNHWVVYHPDYQKLTRERAQARMRGEEVVRRYEVKLQRKDGSWFYGEVNARPITFSSDEERGIQVWVKDIDERKQAEEALRKSEQRMDLAMEGGDIGLWDWNLRTGEVFFDRRWHETLGYSPGDVELNPRTWEKMIHPEDWPGAQQALKDNLRGKIPSYEKEARLKCKSGQWRWMLTSAKVMERDNNGKALRIIGTHQDINDRKLMEIELQIKTLELEETNTALKVLLNHREKDKEELEEKILSNVKSLVEPYLKELKDSRVDQRQIVFLGLLESGLKNILSSFSSKLSSKYLGLTPGELQVAYLIKEGKRTKEIAELQNLSGKTIEGYRKNLRKKLGIRNMKVNLRTHLLSVQK